MNYLLDINIEFLFIIMFVVRISLRQYFKKPLNLTAWADKNNNVGRQIVLFVKLWIVDVWKVLRQLYVESVASYYLGQEHSRLMHVTAQLQPLDNRAQPVIAEQLVQLADDTGSSLGLVLRHFSYSLGRCLAAEDTQIRRSRG